MRNKKRGQISTEYMILMGFIGFIVVGILGVGMMYASQIKDKIKFNQISQAASKIAQTAESVYYSGKPSKLTITVYIPEGVTSISLQGREIVFNVSTNTGSNSIGYTSRVNIETSDGSNRLPPGEGIKKMVIEADTNRAVINLL